MRCDALITEGLARLIQKFGTEKGGGDIVAGSHTLNAHRDMAVIKTC